MVATSSVALRMRSVSAADLSRRSRARFAEALADAFDVRHRPDRRRAQICARAFELRRNLQQAAADFVDLALQASADAIELVAQRIADARHMRFPR